jgi:hypothetical protein
MKTSNSIEALAVTLISGCLVANADVVTDWNSAALDAIRTNNTPPPVASRNLALLHASIHDAVNGIRRTHQSYFVPCAVSANASPEAAATAAACHVLAALYPSGAGSFDTLRSSILARIPEGRAKDAGTAWGEFVASQILVARNNDGSKAAVSAPSGSGPGFWVPTTPNFAPFLLPQWGFVEPFCMASGAQFRPPPPPALNSAEWAQDFNTTKILGSATSSARTADQTEIALFWADGAGTETPPGHWNTIAQHVAAAQGNSLEQNARLFALLNLAMADAAICAWDAKYTFEWWRPVTAIRYGDTDGNDATAADSNWSPLLATPPFPEHVSGHSTFSGAAATVLALFYGTDDIPFTVGSDFMPGIQRSFSSFSVAASEAGMSRIYGGIHFMTANLDGLRGGANIAEWTVSRFLRPKGNRSRE